MTKKVETYFDGDYRKPYDFVGALIVTEYMSGVINNYPREGDEMPFYTSDFYAGNNRTYRVYAKDKNLNTINITGATCVMTWREKKDDDNTLQKSTAVAAQGQITDATHGEMEFYFLPADTSELAIRQYVFDVKVVTSSSKEYTILEGVINLKQSVNN